MNSWHDPFSSWKILFDGDGRCCPTFWLAPLGNGPHSSLLAWLKTESQTQWNNCTKYSPAVTIETSAGASLTSPTVFHFALDPEKKLGGWCLVSSKSNFSQHRWYNRREHEWGTSRRLLLIIVFFFVFFLKGDRREKRCRGVKRLSGKNVDAKGVSGRANLQWQQNRVPDKAGHSYTGLDSTWSHLKYIKAYLCWHLSWDKGRCDTDFLFLWGGSRVADIKVI